MVAYSYIKNIVTGEQYFDYSPDENQWWITGFKPLGAYQTVQADDLCSTVVIDFAGHEDLFMAFRNTPIVYKDWTFDGTTATLVWGVD